MEQHVDAPIPARATATLLRISTWIPVAFTVAFTTLLWTRFGEIVDRVNWDADVATVPVIGATFDPSADAHAVFGHFGWYTILGWELLSRELPFHRQLWEATPYFFALTSAALLGWASWRLAGRWAAAATVALCVCTSSWSTYNLFTLSFHTSTWFSINLVAAYLVLLETTAIATRRLSLLLSVLVGVVTGANAASDPMLVYFGLIPIAATAVAVLVLNRREGGRTAALVGLVLLTAVVVDAAVSELAARLRLTVVEQPAQLASASDLWPNTRRFVRQLLELLNADFWGRGTSFTAGTAVLCAVFVTGAILLAIVTLARRLVSGGRAPGFAGQTALSYLVFWGAVLIVVPASYIFSTVGTHAGWYFVVLVYALAALTPVLAARASQARLITTVGISIFCLASMLAVGRMAYPLDRVGVPEVAGYVPQLERIARQNRASVAYASFWNAAPLTWASDLRLHVYPVAECEQLVCPFSFSVVSTWFEPRTGAKSMLIVTRGDPLVHDPPSASLGDPSNEIQLGDIKVYVYDYDLAARLKPRQW